MYKNCPARNFWSPMYIVHGSFNISQNKREQHIRDLYSTHCVLVVFLELYSYIFSKKIESAIPPSCIIQARSMWNLVTCDIKILLMLIFLSRFLQKSRENFFPLIPWKFLVVDDFSCTHGRLLKTLLGDWWRREWSSRYFAEKSTNALQTTITATASYYYQPTTDEYRRELAILKHLQIQFRFSSRHLPSNASHRYPSRILR